MNFEFKIQEIFLYTKTRLNKTTELADITFKINGIESKTQTASLYEIVTQFVTEANPNFKGLAVAVNNEVIPKSQWATFTVNDMDSVEIITAAQGG